MIMAVTAMRKVDRNIGEALARNPKAAPVFLT
jgi:hypothetical protein